MSLCRLNRALCRLSLLLLSTSVTLAWVPTHTTSVGGVQLRFTTGRLPSGSTAWRKMIKPQQRDDRRIRDHYGRRSRRGNIASEMSMALIDPMDQWAVWATISAAAATGMKAEVTPVGRALSGPICAMLICVVLTNLGVLSPVAGKPVTLLQSFVVTLATPLLLLGADARRVYRETGRLLLAFGLAALGTLLGSSLGFVLFKTQLLACGTDVWKLGAALAAKNIGGGLNFVAVADSLSISPTDISLGLAVDNLLGLMYFPFVSWLGRNEPKDQYEHEFLKQQGQSSNEAVTAEGTAVALAVAAAITACSERLSPLLAPLLGVPPAGARLPAATLLAVAAATAAPEALRPAAASGEALGRVLLFLFFASVGASSGTVAGALGSPAAGALLGAGLALYAVHLGLTLAAGRLLGLPLREVLVASNASVGNAATASALASTQGWQSLVVPAFLVGSTGNSVGTFLGLWLGTSVLRPIVLSVGGFVRP